MHAMRHWSEFPSWQPVDLRSMPSWKEARMSREVKGLAEVVRDAKAALVMAKGAAEKMRASAGQLVDNVSTVGALTRELDNANVELQAAINEMSGGSNGGPPLDDTSTSSGGSSSISVSTAEGALRAIEVLNAGGQ
jgi:hypothetical protein